MTPAAAQQTDDTPDHPAFARIIPAPSITDLGFGINRDAQPPRFAVTLSGSPEATALFAKAHADRRAMQAAIEAAHAARVRAAQAVFNAGDSTRKQRDADIHAADAERIAREDRLTEAFGDFTYDATVERARQAAVAANDQSWRASIAQWKQQP